MLEAFEDATDLPVLAFIQDYFDPAVFRSVAQDVRPASRAEDRHRLFARPASIAVKQRLVRNGCQSGRGRSYQDGFRGASTFAAHSESFVSSSSLRWLCRAAHRTHPRHIFRQTPVNRLSSLLIGGGRDHAARLVHHEIDVCLRGFTGFPSTSIRSLPRWTGASGFRAMVPFKRTRPLRINSNAREREQ